MIEGAVVAGELHLILAAQIGELADNFHDLTGVDVDATVDEHVVRAAKNTVMAGHAEPARALARQQARKVVGAVAQQRHGLLAQAGDHHFAHFALGHGLHGGGVEHFNDEQVGPVVQAFVGVAVDGRAGAVHFGHAADVVTALKTQLAFDGEAHFFAAGFRTANHAAQFDLAAQVGAFHFFGQQQGHGCRGRKAGGAQILQKLQVHFKVAGAHRHGEHAKLFAARLKARASRPQAIAHGKLHAVFGGKTSHFKTAGNLKAKGVDVALGVGQNFALARCSARGVDTRHITGGHAEQGQGIALAQVFHIAGGQAAQVVEACDVVGLYAAGFQLGAILGRIPGLAHGVAQAFKLLAADILIGELGNKAVRHEALLIPLRSWA